MVPAGWRRRDHVRELTRPPSGALGDHHIPATPIDPICGSRGWGRARALHTHRVGVLATPPRLDATQGSLVPFGRHNTLLGALKARLAHP